MLFVAILFDLLLLDDFVLVWCFLVVCLCFDFVVCVFECLIVRL